MKAERPPHHNYRFAGELPHGASYSIELTGPLRASTVRHIIGLLELTAGWLEEDERGSVVDAAGEGESDG